MARTLVLLWGSFCLLAAGYYVGYRSGIRRSAVASQTLSEPRAVEAATKSRARTAEPPARHEAESANSHFASPIDGLQQANLFDTYNQIRGGNRIHEALDIMSPRGTPVRAVVNGTIKKLFNSKPGGLTIYLFDEAGKYSYYYAHLDQYASGLTEGTQVRAGQIIGYVGSTGNADPKAPHLHFAIFELGQEKRWWEGKPINPYPLVRDSLQ